MTTPRTRRPTAVPIPKLLLWSFTRTGYNGAQQGVLVALEAVRQFRELSPFVQGAVLRRLSSQYAQWWYGGKA